MNKIVKEFSRHKQLYIVTIIAVAWVLIFNYIPMLGNVIAFFNYVPGRDLTWDHFVGLDNFKQFFQLPDTMLILRNTLVISSLQLTIGFVAPIVFALLLNEMGNGIFKRFVQTVSYLPYFISWVVVASIMFTVLGNNGVFNELLMKVGLIDKNITWLNEKKYFWFILTAANIWKGVGWSAILYISAIAGVDAELYDAGSVDGLGRFGKLWHITLPGIRPTIILLFILGIGSILNAGFEQQLLIGNPMTRDVYEVIDTYVYRYGIQLGRYSFATAVGMMKSVFGFILVMLANRISGKVADMRIF